MAVVKEGKDQDAEGGAVGKSGISILALFLVCCCVDDDNHDCTILKEARDVVVSIDGSEGEKSANSEGKTVEKKKTKVAQLCIVIVGIESEKERGDFSSVNRKMTRICPTDR
jgi:hypothetical protein